MWIRGEFEDSFKVYYEEKVPPPPGSKKVFHFPFELLDKGTVSAPDWLCASGTLAGPGEKPWLYPDSVYLALYFESIQEYIMELPISEHKKHRQQIAINVPVDLNGCFPRLHCRNFFISLNPELDLALGYHTRSEIIEQIKGYMGLYEQEAY